MLTLGVKRQAEDINAKLHDDVKNKFMTDKDILEFISIISDGFCKHCGSTSLPCHCSNDD